MLVGKIQHDVKRVHVMEQRDTDNFNLSRFTGYRVTFLLTGIPEDAGPQWPAGPAENAASYASLHPQGDITVVLFPLLNGAEISGT